MPSKFLLYIFLVIIFCVCINAVMDSDLKHHIREIFQKSDKNGDGELNFKEFTQFMKLYTDVDDNLAPKKAKEFKELVDKEFKELDTERDSEPC